MGAICLLRYLTPLRYKMNPTLSSRMAEHGLDLPSHRAQVYDSTHDGRPCVLVAMDKDIRSGYIAVTISNRLRSVAEASSLTSLDHYFEHTDVVVKDPASLVQTLKDLASSIPLGHGRKLVSYTV